MKILPSPRVLAGGYYRKSLRRLGGSGRFHVGLRGPVVRLATVESGRPRVTSQVRQYRVTLPASGGRARCRPTTAALPRAVVIIALVAAACGSPLIAPGQSETAALHIVNVDGPDVSILIAGKLVAGVPCGQEATLSPTAPLPRLPWVLVVRATDGGTLGHVAVSNLPLGVLIRGNEVLSGPWPMSYGPAGGGCPASPT